MVVTPEQALAVNTSDLEEWIDGWLLDRYDGKPTHILRSILLDIADHKAVTLVIEKYRQAGWTITPVIDAANPRMDGYKFEGRQREPKVLRDQIEFGGAPNAQAGGW